MPRPTKLTRVRHARIVELLRDGTPFATACREVGISPSAGYEWLYRGWGTHPDRPAAPVYVAFAQDVDALFPGGFAERYPDDADEGQAASFAEPQKRTENGRAPSFVDVQSNEGTATSESREGFAEVTGPDEIRHEKRTRAREPEEPTDRAWLSQRSRAERSILDMEF
jgi:hypothetical protein